MFTEVHNNTIKENNRTDNLSYLFPIVIYPPSKKKCSKFIFDTVKHNNQYNTNILVKFKVRINRILNFENIRY